MKKFNFKLQKYLELRQFQEKEAEIELGKAISNRETIQNKLNDLAKNKLKYNQERGSSKTIENLVFIEQYLNKLEKEKESLLKELTLAEIEVDKARNIYSKALVKRKTITKLKEKKYNVWRKEYFSEQESQLDDIINTFSKNNS